MFDIFVFLLFLVNVFLCRRENKIQKMHKLNLIKIFVAINKTLTNVRLIFLNL